MALDKDTFKQALKNAWAAGEGKDKDAAIEAIADAQAQAVIDLIKSATVKVPGAGLTGYNLTPIQGESITGDLS